MRKSGPKQPSGAELRHLAEQRLRSKQARTPEAPQDQARLIQELQIHQLELEMQNEELRRLRDELEVSLARYTELYDFAPVGYLTLDGKGTILEINLGGAALLGKERARLIGQSLTPCLAAAARPAFNAFLGVLHEGAGKASCDVVLATHGDRMLHVHIDGMREPAGQDWRCRAAMTDVTQRVEAEDVLRTQRARLTLSYDLTSTLSSAPTTVDVARVVFEKGLAVFGADAGALAVSEGQDPGMLRIVAHFGYPEELVEAWRRFPATLASPITDAYRTGAAIWVDSPAAALARFPAWAPAVMKLADRAWAGLPLRAEGRTFGVLGLAFWHERVFEDEERELMQSLADRCAQALDRARLLEAEREARARAETSEEGERLARREAERVGDLQRLTLSVVGHDLRSPLQAIKLSTELLVRRGDLNNAQAESVVRIARSAGRIAGIVRDLLDYTRARQGETLQIDREEVKLDDVCRLIVLEMRTVHPDREIAFDSSGECLGAWDPVRVGQVVSNLVSNALQHGPPTSGVRVSLTADDAAATITVFNEGPPIPREAQTFIFEPYRRAETERGAGRGLGLGLFIVREIARAHGGEVTLESANGGTSFVVRLPRRAHASSASPTT
ncbi:MAG: ATP-binding protein [Myxococcaceae bacterium]